MSRLTSAATIFFANFASFVRQQFFASRQNPLPSRHAAVERNFWDGDGRTDEAAKFAACRKKDGIDRSC
jgi:hypothetical protein